MPTATAKTIFVLSCLLCLIAIAGGAILEIVRQQKGESVLRPSQFRLRIFSALVWIIALGAMAYAVAFFWPNPALPRLERREMAEKFLSLISGSLSLLFIGILLLAYDMWQLSRERRVKEAQFNLQLMGMAREEIAKAQNANFEIPVSDAPVSHLSSSETTKLPEH